MCLGTTCSIQTFLKNTKTFSNPMSKAMHSLSNDETIIIAAIDNNQKGYDLYLQTFWILW